MQMRAFVTGAGGFIGAHLAEELIKRGHEVIGLFMPEEDSLRAEKTGIMIRRGDITRPETLEELFDNTDIVFHLATRTSDWGAASTFDKIMVQGTENILRACRKSAPRFIYFSSIAALGLNRHLDGFDEEAAREVTGIGYCDTKIKAENLVRTFCQEHGMDYTIIRPANVIGPGSVWVKDILDAFERGPIPLVAGGKVSGAFVYVDNLVDGALLAAQSDAARNQTYHFRDDYDMTWGAYVTYLGAHINKKPFGSIPFHAAWYLGWFFEMILTPLHIRPPMTRLAAGVFGRDNDVDTTKAKKELGWSTRVPLDEALEKISSWIKEVYIPSTFDKNPRVKRFYRKIAFITGGSSGIGFATARELVRHGADVVLIARDSKKLDAAKNSLDAVKLLPDQTIGVISMDVANPAEVNEKMKSAVENFGAPDILINSAGINKYADHFENITCDMFSEVMNINVNGVRNVTCALLPAMKEKKGHIVILSSAAALFGMFGYTAYGTSKAALMGFSESLRYELAPLKMPVTVVFPPEVDTPMNLDEAKTLPPEGRAMKSMAGLLAPDYVARVIIKAMVKRKYFVIPGFQTRFLYFFHRHTNGAISRLVSDFIIKWTIKKQRRKK
jgi:nucleoside-diphosphate-sugar epimerase